MGLINWHRSTTLLVFSLSICLSLIVFLDFRIFNPTTQGTTHDPNGDYIKKYVPELAKLSGKAVHEPYKHLTKKEFEKLGYPKPIVEHTFARKRAIARFKNPGERVDE